MLVGYVRVSSADQNEQRQVLALQEKSVDRIYAEKASGQNADRAELKKMLEYVREGDTVITESISRIARSTKDFLNIIEQLTQKGVNFVSLKENLDTATPQGRFMLTVFAALAELERENIRQRQKEGIAIAKAEGKYKGRKPIEIDEEQFKSICKLWRNGEISAVEAQKRLGIKANTFYRRVKNLK